ncbi:T9SS type A sorting domain-containing protein [Hymenobacter segetis]|uniref:T9SS type A sorting domain-containing protein n=1 Tax=Hymenobacter segetis TaxID=2025509 RepID=A0ABU9LRV9_9BACT
MTLSSAYSVGNGGSISVDDGVLTILNGGSISVAVGGTITVSSRAALNVSNGGTIDGNAAFTLGDGTSSLRATNLIVGAGSSVRVDKMTVDKATVSIAAGGSLTTVCNLILLSSNIVSDGAVNIGGNLDLSVGGANNTLCGSSNKFSGSLTVAGCVYGGNGATTHLLNNCAAAAISVCVKRTPSAGCGAALAAANTNEANCDAEAPSIRCTALPVELTLFNAQVLENQQVDLNWVTASEKNSRAFVVERSSDGKVFRELSSVAAAGTTQYQTTYHTTDERPLPATSYYRLRQIDLDGTYSFSPVRAVKVDRLGSSLAVYPGRAAQEWVVSTSLPAETLAQGPATVRVFDALGRLLPVPCAADAARPGQWVLSLRSLPTGVYVVRLITAAGSFSQRISQ